MTGQAMTKVSAESLRALTAAVLAAWGMPVAAAGETAALIVETDLSGVDSHGVSMLPFYEGLRDAGDWVPDAEPRLVRESPCTALLDGGHGLGHRTAMQAMRLAADKAQRIGLGAVAVSNSNHFGAAGLYARAAAERGLIGLVASTTRSPMLVPTRASVPVLGTNPLAFAAPARRNRPFVLDIATTTVAANKVKVYDLQSRDIPAGWVVDEAGRPVTSSARAMDYLFRRPEGGLTALGGVAELGSHKGYGLGMLAQILAGPLCGAAFAPLRGKDDKPNIGHFFLALDPAAFRGEDAFENELDAIVDALHATPAADPALPVLVAGDPEAQTREARLRDGIPLPDRLQAQLREICRRAGVSHRLEVAAPSAEVV
ncbi:Ldh family oxidoreductase [Azotobacter beijerinckii]|uniref:Ldh family oxidoreductase n=1 Tax=Azotobacter beijerinckii TaxID=170623 RepID=UPI0029542B99|nr:Ldh family oxidoreductase [Azotobacter beijerinckii]MDV7213526.1 Ldh family oxidoreductase [Azotobacter beijerinckii]